VIELGRATVLHACDYVNAPVRLRIRGLEEGYNPDVFAPAEPGEGCMHEGRIEHLPYQGESASDRLAYQRYLDEIKRGKSLLQLIAVQKALTSEIRQSWSARSFTPVQTSQGIFDDVVCNISYHFNKHGAKYGSIANMTQEAQKYFKQNRQLAVQSSGILKLPHGSFEQDGRIITFF
jgi:hypothetical protein